MTETEHIIRTSVEALTVAWEDRSIEADVALLCLQGLVTDEVTRLLALSLKQMAEECDHNFVELFSALSTLSFTVNDLYSVKPEEEKRPLDYLVRSIAALIFKCGRVTFMGIQFQDPRLAR